MSQSQPTESSLSIHNDDTYDDMKDNDINILNSLTSNKLNNLNITNKMLLKSSTIIKTKNQTDSQYIAKLLSINLSDKNIKNIDNLDKCIACNILIITTNSISSITNINKLINLTHLYLEYNNISYISGLNTLINLKKLYLDHNKIVSLAGLENCNKLEELHLNHQKPEIPATGFHFDKNTLINLKELSVLQLADCGVVNVDELNCLTKLTRLNLADNSLSDMQTLEYMVRGCRRLTTLTLTGNIIKKYRDNLIIQSDSLENLDEKTINSKERQYVRLMDARRKVKNSINNEEREINPMQPRGREIPR